MIRDHLLFTTLIPTKQLKDQKLESIVAAMQDDTNNNLFVCEHVHGEDFLDHKKADFIGKLVAGAYRRALESRAERALWGSDLKDST